MGLEKLNICAININWLVDLLHCVLLVIKRIYKAIFIQYFERGITYTKMMFHHVGSSPLLDWLPTRGVNRFTFSVL
jgi:hypothetical protein